MFHTDPLAHPLAEEGGGATRPVLQDPHIRPQQKTDQPNSLLVYPDWPWSETSLKQLYYTLSSSIETSWTMRLKLQYIIGFSSVTLALKTCLTFPSRISSQMFARLAPGTGNSPPCTSHKSSCHPGPLYPLLALRSQRRSEYILKECSKIGQYNFYLVPFSLRYTCWGQRFRLKYNQKKQSEYPNQD